MSALSAAKSVPRVSARVEDGCLRVAVGGHWRVTTARPAWGDALAKAGLVFEPRRGRGDASNEFSIAVTRVRLEPADDLVGWDSALVIFVGEALRWCRAHDAYCDLSALPEALRKLADRLTGAAEPADAAPPEPFENPLATLGHAAVGVWEKVGDIATFVGECALGAARVALAPTRFRWRDCLREMQECGALALPIVSLISFLTGVTLAYTGAIVLRQYGGDIYIADLIGLAMVRETGAVMTAVVLAGRTGAAFAATLGNMKAGEEIDALTTFGIRPVDFLVLPRVVALGVMMPLLALYANALGVIGGMTVAYGLLNISPVAYWGEMMMTITQRSINVGLIKATAFGLIVGLAGCLRGLQAERSAAGVGRAATSAVVTALLLLVIADAFFAVAFNALGW
jgi:phospholipid/cholesterol/gamma-HCH transport system permease protein